MITDNETNEFWFHVSKQDAMPIAGEVPQFVDRKAITSLISQFEGKDELQLSDISILIKSNIQNIDLLRSLIGISDKRMYLDLSYLFYKEKYYLDDTTNILGHNLYNVNSHPLKFYKNKINDTNQILANKSLEIITQYLNDGGIVPVLNALCKIGPKQSHILIDKLINAKEAQQKLTKRRGHGIEQTFAQFLNSLNVKYLPADRHENPMSRDPNVLRRKFQSSRKINGKTWSFDLILEENNQHYAYIQGLIHTSDPGQYGVNKSDETVIIKRDLEEFNSNNKELRELWGLVDGVGFTENKKNTINKMLIEFDTFIQLKSLYKAALKLHERGQITLTAIKFDNNFYSESEAQLMFEKYGSKNIEFYYGESPKDYKTALIGGKATIYF